MTNVTASYIFDGLSDYWQGDGRRWDEDAGCLFATIGPDTTYADLIDEWVQDSYAGDFDGKEPFEDLTDDELREALRDVFVDGLDLNTLHPIAEQMRQEYNHTPVHCCCAMCSDKVPDYPTAIVLVQIDSE